HLEGAIEQPRVSVTDTFEATIDQCCEPTFLALRMHEARAHEWRQRERHDSRDDDCSRERNRELQEQRASEPTLKCDRRIDRGKRDRHCDDGSLQFARTDQRRLYPRLALPYVALDVL